MQLLVQELRDFFQEVHGEHEISFPEQLPISALVGCVTVVDVLTVGSLTPLALPAANSLSMDTHMAHEVPAFDRPVPGSIRAAACSMLV